MQQENKQQKFQQIIEQLTPEQMKHLQYLSNMQRNEEDRAKQSWHAELDRYQLRGIKRANGEDVSRM